jgi:hypothetical protein
MRHLHSALFFGLAMSAALPAVAGGHGIHVDTDNCKNNYSTQYDVDIRASGIDFFREDGTPAKVFMHDGALRVDGKAIAVSAADADSLRRYEADVRELVPEVAAIAREGVDIGFAAMTSVTAAFAEDGDTRARLVDKLKHKRIEAMRRIDDGLGAGKWRRDDADRIVEDAVSDTVGDLVGTVTASAVSAALSGDQSKVAALQARANSLDATIKREVDTRADKLEARANALCPKLAELDRLQRQWQFRLSDGSPLQLMKSEPHHRSKDPKKDDDDTNVATN